VVWSWGLTYHISKPTKSLGNIGHLCTHDTIYTRTRRLRCGFIHLASFQIHMAQMRGGMPYWPPALVPYRAQLSVFLELLVCISSYHYSANLSHSYGHTSEGKERLYC
jgi:hypothetical protein